MVNEAAGSSGIVLTAAGSMPGDLHKLWRTGDPGSYHVEYGYSAPATASHHIPAPSS